MTYSPLIISLVADVNQVADHTALAILASSHSANDRRAMPNIIIPEVEVKKYQSRTGIYTKLREAELRITNKQLKQAIHSLNESVTLIVRQSFLEYATAHSCPKDKLELEWNRFNKFLQKSLNGSDKDRKK
jgi:hypothetical protein